MKRTSILTAIFTVALLQANTQHATPDKIETNKGALTIQPIEHATMVLNWDGKTIYVDPTGGAAAFADMEKPDIVLLTDIHGELVKGILA